MTKRYTQKEDDWEILDNGKHLAYAHSAYQAEKIIETLNWKEEKIKELQERNNRQCELLEKQQEQIDNIEKHIIALQMDLSNVQDTVNKIKEALK